MARSTTLRFLAVLVFAFAVQWGQLSHADSGKDGGGQSDDGGDGGGDDDDDGGDDAGGGGNDGGKGGGGGGASGKSSAGSSSRSAGSGDDDDDHDRARDLVSRGEIHSLQEIVRGLMKKIPGEIVGVKLSQRGSQWIYSFRIVASGGKMVEVDVDAKKMTIVSRARK